MNADDPSDTTYRTAPVPLWRVASAFMHLLHGLFGAPEDVAARHTITLAAHTLLASWLRCAEAMLRRLLVIEASAYAKPNTRPLLHPTKLLGRKRARKLIGFDAEHPEKWRVSFRTFGPPAPSRQKKCRQDAGGPRQRISREDRWSFERFERAKLRSAWPLAERYEALLRVINAPAAFARRLAARLHATAHRLGELLRAPAEAHDRVDDFALMGDEARSRWRAPDSG